MCRSRTVRLFEVNNGSRLITPSSDHIVIYGNLFHTNFCIIFRENLRSHFGAKSTSSPKRAKIPITTIKLVSLIKQDIFQNSCTPNQWVYNCVHYHLTYNTKSTLNQSQRLINRSLWAVKRSDLMAPRGGEMGEKASFWNTVWATCLFKQKSPLIPGNPHVFASRHVLGEVVFSMHCWPCSTW